MTPAAQPAPTHVPPQPRARSSTSHRNSQRLLCHHHIPSIAHTGQQPQPHLSTSFQPHEAAIAGSPEPQQLIPAQTWCSISQSPLPHPQRGNTGNISRRAAPALAYRNPSAQALHGTFPDTLRFCASFVQDNGGYKVNFLPSLLRVRNSKMHSKAGVILRPEAHTPAVRGCKRGCQTPWGCYSPFIQERRGFMATQFQNTKARRRQVLARG